MSDFKIVRVYGTWEVYGFVDVPMRGSAEEAIEYAEGTSSPDVILGGVDDSFEFEKVEIRP